MWHVPLWSTNTSLPTTDQEIRTVSSSSNLRLSASPDKNQPAINNDVLSESVPKKPVSHQTSKSDDGGADSSYINTSLSGQRKDLESGEIVAQTQSLTDLADIDEMYSSGKEVFRFLSFTVTTNMPIL